MLLVLFHFGSQITYDAYIPYESFYPFVLNPYWIFLQDTTKHKSM